MTREQVRPLAGPKQEGGADAAAGGAAEEGGAGAAAGGGAPGGSIFESDLSKHGVRIRPLALFRNGCWTIRAERKCRRRNKVDHCFSADHGLTFLSKEEAEDQLSPDKFSSILLRDIWPSPRKQKKRSPVPAAAISAVTPAPRTRATAAVTAAAMPAAISAVTPPPVPAAAIFAVTPAPRTRETTRVSAADAAIGPKRRRKTLAGDDDLRRNNGGHSTRSLTPPPALSAQQHRRRRDQPADATGGEHQAPPEDKQEACRVGHARL